MIKINNMIKINDMIQIYLNNLSNKRKQGVNLLIHYNGS